MRIHILLIISIMIITIIPISHSSLSFQNTRSAQDTWTFMVYMDADNSLSQYAPSDLAEMMSVGSSEYLHIIVLYDGPENGDSAIYRIDNGKKTLLKSLGEVDMGSADTLKNFISFTVANYPASHYFLDFWDHGNNYGGVCIDHGDWLTLQEMDNALSYFDEKIGKKVDVVGFDACRMGSISVLYALKDYAYYAVASEKDEPANGWPYDSVLSNLPGKNPEQAAKVVANQMYIWASNIYKDEGLSVTMAAVNLTRMNSFIEIFNRDLEDSLPLIPYFTPEILNVTSDVERYEYSVDVDFYQLMEKIDSIGDLKLSKLANDVMSEITNMTYSRAWDCPHPANGYHAKYAHGIAIYYPTYYISSSYSLTSFAKHTYWDDFLDEIHTPYYINGYGTANISIEGYNITVQYSTNGSYTDIYLLNSINGSVVYSGILNPSGNYTFHAPYGVYKIYIYSYNPDGYAIWTYRKSVEHLKKIVIAGEFLINGRVVPGAKIGLILKNKSVWTVQGDHGFSFTIYYPRDINNETNLRIEVIYGPMKWSYEKNITSYLRGSNYIPIKIDERIFPGPLITIISTSLITIFAVAMLIWFRKK